MIYIYFVKKMNLLFQIMLLLQDFIVVKYLVKFVLVVNVIIHFYFYLMEETNHFMNIKFIYFLVEN